MSEAEIIFKIFLWAVIIVSAIFHEYAHAWTANTLGDPTAKYAGRLTLNPLAHIDPMWTVAVPLFLLFFFNAFIGMAKPVPYNPYNLRAKYGAVFVGLAGPATNLILAFLLGSMLRFLALSVDLALAISFIVYINIFLGLFNLIPVPPLDGSRLIFELFPESRRFEMMFSPFGIIIAVFIAILVLVPVSRALFYLIVGQPFPIG